MHGNVLGEAAHRLLKNSLNIRSTGGPPSGYYDNQQNYQNTPGNNNNNFQHRPRPSRNPNEDQFYYQNYPNPRASMPRPNNYRPNTKPQEYQDLSNSMSALTMDNGSRGRQYPVRAAPPQSSGGILPSPPPTWISRPEGTVGAYDKDVKKVYQIKTRD